MYIASQEHHLQESGLDTSASIREASTPSDDHGTITETEIQVASVCTIETDNPDPEWHLNFLTPHLRVFSASVHDAVKTGVIEGRARREIIHVLRTYVTAHTIQPTSEQYKAVCQALITKYPTLRDDEGKNSYVSKTWT